MEKVKKNKGKKNSKPKRRYIKDHPIKVLSPEELFREPLKQNENGSTDPSMVVGHPDEEVM